MSCPGGILISGRAIRRVRTIVLNGQLADYCQLAYETIATRISVTALNGAGGDRLASSSTDRTAGHLPAAFSRRTAVLQDGRCWPSVSIRDRCCQLEGS
jgi:hypothetical protein